MRKLNKLILVGLVAFCASCSNEQSTTGATTEPNTSPVATLTNEQKAILAKSLFTLMNPSVADSLKNVFDSAYASSGYDINKMYNDYISPYPWSVRNNQVFRHPSKDERKVCDVVTYTMENGIVRNGVFRATSYDDEQLCSFSSVTEPRCTSQEAAEDYFYNHPHETITDTKFTDVDGVPVMINTIGSLEMRNGFWGYGVKCIDLLNQFKQSCDESNGLFLDLGDGCNQDDLELVCASFIPDGQTPDEVLAYYTELYQSQCLEDSINYAPYDDENYTRVYPFWDQTYLDSLNRFDGAEREWANTLKQTVNAYRWQFTIIDSTVKVGQNGKVTYQENKDPNLYNGWSLGYNTLPNTPVADAFRNEGIYVLPDSLLTTFFPKLAEYPGRLDEFRTSRSPKNSIYYLIVLKDVGAKGHLLTRIDENGIFVTDIVKSGNSCPEDTTVHYPIMLLANSPDWDALNRPIMKSTYVSDKWNCDNPESLAKIEPYGEWIISRTYYFEDYVKLFGKD